MNNMYKISCIIISSFGFFMGTMVVVPHISAYFMNPDYPFHFSLILSRGLYIGLFVLGILAYKNYSFAKYLIALLVVAWIIYHFEQLFWPLNTPEFQMKHGNVGLEAWKPTVDILLTGIFNSGLLIFCTLKLFKNKLRN